MFKQRQRRRLTACGARTPRHSKYLLLKVAAYLEARLETPREDAVLLVLRSSNEGCDAVATEDSSEPASAPTLGVCELSLAPHTRTFEDKALLPPPHAAYVKNMSVDSCQRRRGVGTALLAAAEAYAADVRSMALAPVTPRLYPPPLEMFLHVALNDVPARALYERCGYVVVAEQSALMAFLRRSGPPVALMRKRLPG